jgi:hypothetical protein
MLQAHRIGEFLLGRCDAYFIDADLLQRDTQPPQSRDKGVCVCVCVRDLCMHRDLLRRIAGDPTAHTHVVWPFAAIRELHKRRRMLRDTALEIFVFGGRTHMLNFATKAVRDQVCACARVHVCARV